MATNQNIGAVTKPIISAVELLDERDIAREIFDLQDDAEWTQLMLEMGRRETTKVPWYDNFYNEARHFIINTTGATVQNSGTTTVTITNLPTGSNNYLIVGDVLLFPDGGNGMVTTVSTTTLPNDTIVVKSVDADNLTLVAGNNLSHIGTANEEGSSAHAARRFNLASIRNQIQIFDENFEITDIQGMSHRTVMVNGQPHILPQANIDAVQRLRALMAASWFGGKASATKFSDANPALTGANGRGVQTTRGLDQYIELYGVKHSVTTPGEFTTLDAMDLTDALTAAKAPAQYMMVGGNSPKNVFDNWLKNLGSSGVQSVRLQGDGKDTNFECERFEYGGFEFNLKRLKLLSNPQIFNYVAGSAKPEIARSMYLMPMGKCPVYGGGTTDYFGMKYMPVPQGFVNGVRAIDGDIAEFRDGGLAGHGTDMVFKARLVAQMGVNIKKPQVFSRLTVQ